VIGWIAPLLVFAAVAWLALLVAAPFLPAMPAALVYAAGSLVCHQLTDRSFHLGGFQLPVCARCLGIYAGAACGTLITLSRVVQGSDPGTARRVVAVAALPTLVTVAAEWAGTWPTSNAVRFAAGVPLGLAVAMVVRATLHYGECARRPRIGSPRPPSPI
jgi:uncharacterized membrane protein